MELLGSSSTTLMAFGEGFFGGLSLLRIFSRYGDRGRDDERDGELVVSNKVFATRAGLVVLAGCSGKRPFRCPP